MMREIIESAWNNRDLLEESETQETIRSVIEQLDQGKIRVAEPFENGWRVNEWIKKQLYFIFLYKKWKLIKQAH